MKVISAREGDVFDDQDAWSEGYEIFLSFTKEEIDNLVAQYDPLSPVSPSVSLCRPTVRAILDKILDI